MVIRNLVVRAGERVHAAIDYLDEVFNRSPVCRLGLADEATDQGQNVAHAMIEFRDQQFLPA